MKNNEQLYFTFLRIAASKRRLPTSSLLIDHLPSQFSIAETHGSTNFFKYFSRASSRDTTSESNKAAECCKVFTVLEFLKIQRIHEFTLSSKYKKKRKRNNQNY